MLLKPLYEFETDHVLNAYERKAFYGGWQTNHKAITKIAYIFAPKFEGYLSF